MPRGVVLFAAVFVLVVVVGLSLGSANISLLLLNAAAYALVALGLNITWGYGGLFNVGILGFLMLGGFGVTFVAAPVNTAFWNSDGPLMLGKALLAFIAGAALVYGARRADRIGIRGGWKAALTALVWLLAYILYRSQIDPAARYIETSAGWIGGLGLPPLLGWAFGGLLAAAVAYVIGRICLGLRTDYLAIATIGISEIVRAFLKNADWLTRGTLTVSPIPWPTPLPQALQASGMPITDSFVVARLTLLAVIFVVLAGSMFLVERAYGGPWGRMMRAIRDNFVAADSMGKNVTARQLQLFVFGSVLMGIGGAVLVTIGQIYDPGAYQPISHTFMFWVIVIVGGSGNNWGAVLGALLIYVVWIISDPLSQALFTWVSQQSTHFGWAAIPDIESRASQMRVFVLGIVIALALRYAPRGLLPEVVRRER